MHMTLAVILSLSPCCIRVADEVQRQRFLSEYPLAERQLRQQYGALRIVSESTYTNTRRDEKVAKDLPTESKIVYLANHGNFRVDRELLGGTKERQGASGFVLGPDGPFIVDRKAGTSKYHIRIAEPTALGPPSDGLEMLAGISPVAFAPYAYSHGTVTRMLRQPKFVVEDATTTNGDSGLVAVKWKWGELPPGSVGEWVFDSTKSWAMVSYRYRTQLPDGTWKAEVAGETQYEGALGDVPIVKSHEYVVKNLVTGEIRDRGVTTVKEIGPSEAIADQFVLAAYGLRFAQGVPANRPGKWLVYFGGGAIGLAVLVRWVLKRRQA